MDNNNKDNFDNHISIQKSNNLQAKGEYENFNTIDDKLSNRTNSDLSRRMKRKKKFKYNFSIKYKIFLVILWIIFVASFIVGFIVHFDVKNSVNASSIIWAFSFFIFCICVVYSIIYYKAKNSRSQEELGKYLKFVPI